MTDNDWHNHKQSWILWFLFLASKYLELMRVWIALPEFPQTSGSELGFPYKFWNGFDGPAVCMNSSWSQLWTISKLGAVGNPFLGDCNVLLKCACDQHLQSKAARWRRCCSPPEKMQNLQKGCPGESSGGLSGIPSTAMLLRFQAPITTENGTPSHCGLRTELPWSFDQRSLLVATRNPTDQQTAPSPSSDGLATWT